MRKILSIVIIAAMLMMCVPFAVSAKVGNTNLNYGTVTIDGNFSANKWSAAAPLTVDASNTISWVGGPMEASVSVYALWDEQGLYFGGEIQDSDVLLSAPDSYSGDAFQISLDLGQILQNSGERGIFHSLGIHEDASGQILEIQESHNDRILKDGEEGIKVKTKATANGWSYELFMPWTLLNADVSEKGGSAFTPEAGGKIDALICYLDRGIAGASGTFAEGADMWAAGDHGATFVLQAKPAPPEVTAPQPPEAPVPTPAQTSVTTAPSTGDISVLIILRLFVTASMGIIVLKRRKNII